MTDESLSSQEKFDFLEQYESDLAGESALGRMASTAQGSAVTAVYEVHREK